MAAEDKGLFIVGVVVKACKEMTVLRDGVNVLSRVEVGKGPVFCFSCWQFLNQIQKRTGRS